ncbi:uncharacterized protein LOC102808055 [Saccoglossus kowalevskii]|uniref:Histone H2A n=1 Tax=Saccoglossus kowalevskii TaxID=10224 RepID=A0ABM0MAI9_SACKO|nr:PREDICTED: probable histone H2A.1-like [Saccoglossus kowalevskii]
MAGTRKENKKTRTTISSKAGVIFPVARLRRYLKKGRYSQRTAVSAGIYLAAVLEYLTAEIMELAGNAAQDYKKKTVGPRHIMLGVRNDTELDQLLRKVTISRGGVIPHIHPVLIPKK